MPVLILWRIWGGCGFIANALHQECPESTIFSYELSEAAVLYAQQHFEHVKFIVKAIDIDDHFTEGPFDAIICNEFYPFTRNNDAEYQIAYIDTFLNNLTSKGTLMINCLDTTNSLIHIFEQIRKELIARGYWVEKKIIPAVKIHLVVHNISLSVILTRILAFIFRKKVGYSVIIQKS